MCVTPFGLGACCDLALASLLLLIQGRERQLPSLFQRRADIIDDEMSLPKVTFVNSRVGDKSMDSGQDNAAVLCDNVFIRGLCDKLGGTEELSFSKGANIIVALSVIALLAAHTSLYVYDRMLSAKSQDAPSTQVARKQRRNKPAKKSKAGNKSRAATANRSITADTTDRHRAAEISAAGQHSGACEDEEEQPGSDSDRTCSVCMDAPRDAAILHAGSVHVCCCMECALTIHKSGGDCPICRVPIESVLRAFD